MFSEKLIGATLRGIKQELTHSEILAIVYQDLLLVNADEDDTYGFERNCVDDMSGKILDTTMFTAANKKKWRLTMQTRPTTRDTFQSAGKLQARRPVRCRWIDMN